MFRSIPGVTSIETHLSLRETKHSGCSIRRWGSSIAAMRVFWPGPPDASVYENLRAKLPQGMQLVEGGDYEILVDGRPKPEHLAPSLKHVIVPFAGVPQPTLELLRERLDLKGYNLHHNASATAEMALALLFAAAKGIVRNHNLLAQNDWTPRYEDSRALSLDGKTALILGYGSIGRRVGAVLSALGMEVLAVRKNPDSGQHAISALHELLSRADVLMVTLPLTPETKGLIGAAELALLPVGAVLVNVARGPIVDEEALYNALRDGRLHSAGLDVWYSYPESTANNALPGYFDMPTTAKDTSPSAFSFGELWNVVMSPHIGGASMDTEEHRVRDLAALLDDIEQGRHIENLIDPERGY